MAGSIAMIGLLYVCVPGGAVQIEQDLLTRGRLALLRAGLPADGLAFDGRDAILAGPRGSVQVSSQALRVVSQVEGVRRVEPRYLEASARQPQPSVDPAVVHTLQEQINRIAPRGVQFEPGSARLSPQGQATLDAVGGILRKYYQFPVEIQGYADYTGDPGVTMELSRRRAAAARIYLIAKGVASAQVTAAGYGNRADRRTQLMVKAPR